MAKKTKAMCEFEVALYFRDNNFIFVEVSALDYHRLVSNGNNVTFEAKSDWGIVTHKGFYPNSTRSRIMEEITPLSQPRMMNEGDTMEIGIRVDPEPILYCDIKDRYRTPKRGSAWASMI